MIRFPSYIVIDFDGTVVRHRYPAVGEEIGAVPVLQKLIRNGHQLILNTMRSHNSQGKDTLQPALDWFKERGIPLYGVNCNPSQEEWTSSPKIYGNIYIDDSALGAPLKTEKGDAIPYIDWELAAIHLFSQGYLTQKDIFELINEGIIDKDCLAPENVE